MFFLKLRRVTPPFTSFLVIRKRKTRICYSKNIWLAFNLWFIKKILMLSEFNPLRYSEGYAFNSWHFGVALLNFKTLSLYNTIKKVTF
jgi:hypothetical protein